MLPSLQAHSSSLCSCPAFVWGEELEVHDNLPTTAAGSQRLAGSTVGSVGSCHTRIKPPCADVPLYFNWKLFYFYSVQIQAVCDHQYWFWTYLPDSQARIPACPACCSHCSIQGSRVDFHSSRIQLSSRQSLVYHWKGTQDYVQMASNIFQSLQSATCICSKGRRFFYYFAQRLELYFSPREQFHVSTVASLDQVLVW